MTSKLDRYIQRAAQLGAEIHSLRPGRGVPPQVDSGNGWQPRFDIYHHQLHLFIDVELPGVPAESVTVEAHPGMIVLRGEKPGLAQLPDREEILSSREFGSFQSQFAIPPGFALDGLEQRLDHGVMHLKVRLSSSEAPADGLENRS